jgi:hypothetical protein
MWDEPTLGSPQTSNWHPQKNAVIIGLLIPLAKLQVSDRIYPNNTVRLRRRVPQETTNTSIDTSGNLNPWIHLVDEKPGLLAVD